MYRVNTEPMRVRFDKVPCKGQQLGMCSRQMIVLSSVHLRRELMETHSHWLSTSPILFPLPEI